MGIVRSDDVLEDVGAGFGDGIRGGVAAGDVDTFAGGIDDGAVVHGAGSCEDALVGDFVAGGLVSADVAGGGAVGIMEAFDAVGFLPEGEEFLLFLAGKCW